MNHLTSLRGIAALLVVFFHIKTHLHQIPVVRSFRLLYDNGYLAVDFFFILSGFIITYKYRDYFRENARDNFYRFCAKRIARIYPLHAFVLALYVGLAMLLLATGRTVDGHEFGLLQFLGKALLVDLWMIGTSTWDTWNVPSWTISGELAAYLLFPALVLAAQSVGRTWRILAIGAAPVALATAYYLHGCESLGDCIGTLGLLRCVVEFTLGMGVSMLHSHFRGGNSGRNSAVILVAGLALLGLALASDLGNYLYVPVLFAVILYGSLDLAGVIRRILDSKPLVYLGDISYSVYLTHMLVATVVFNLTLQTGELAGAGVIALYLLATILFSSLSYRFIEVPLRSTVYERMMRHRPGDAGRSRTRSGAA